MDKYTVKIRLNNGRTIEIYNVFFLDREDDAMVKVTYLLAKHGDEAVIYIPVRNIEIIYVNPVVDHSKDEESETAPEKQEPKETEG